jgi:hypothetical protein
MKKALSPFALIVQGIRKQILAIKASKILHDRLSVVLVLVAIGVNALNIFLLLSHIPASKAQVPTHYSSLTGFEGLGPWYTPIEIALFGLGITVINGFLALLSFGKSRLSSFFLLSVACVSALFCLVISNALAMVGQ